MRRLALLACLPTLACAAPASPAGTGLPDTGQTTRFTRTFGEDADYLGRAPAYRDNRDGTVTDLVTGLIWQKVDGGEMTWEKAKEYAKNLRLAGQTDWRLPNSMELLSLMNHGMHGPAMDTEVFPRSGARYWWTDAVKQGDSGKVWLVNTGGGIGAHAKTETVSAGGDRPVHVRCVRGTCSLGAGPDLKDNGDGTVTDRRTGLVWQKVGEAEKVTWEDALRRCSTLDLAGRKDWRLPNIKELRSLSDDGRTDPSLDRAFFPGASPTAYWSATTQVNRPERAWYVDFANGLVTYADKTDRLLLRAVRGGAEPTGPREKPEPPPAPAAGPGKPKPKGGKKKGE
jgi:hypothetical protein